MVNQGIAAVIRALCSEGADSGIAEIRIADVKPGQESGIEQIDRLRKTVGIYSKTVGRIADLNTARCHPHPWFGPLNARSWHALAAVHNGLHRRQIEKIIGGLADRI